MKFITPNEHTIYCIQKSQIFRIQPKKTEETQRAFVGPSNWWSMILLDSLGLAFNTVYPWRFGNHLLDIWLTNGGPAT